MEKKKRITFGIIGVFLLIMALAGVTYAFFNYTRTGVANSFSVGRIYFNTTQDGNISLTNVFPISSDDLSTDTLNHDSVTINITGDTTYNDGIEYLVTLDQVNNTINDKQIPIAFTATATNIGTPSNDYFNERGNTTSVYSLTENGIVEEDKQILVGYITKGETGINGSIDISAYLDASKIAISDTYDSNAVASTPESCFTFSNNTITDYDVNCGLDVVIPKTINGNSVTKIGNDAFALKDLTSVTIPDSVTTIGIYAFRWNQLTSVVIPNSVKIIEKNAFYLNDLVSVILGTGVERIEKSAFQMENGQYGASNMELTTIVNKSGRSFDWNDIFTGNPGNELTNFATGTYNYGTGTVNIVAGDGNSEVPITDEYGTTSSWVNGRAVFTTEEWNSFASNGVSFKIRVEANEGIWVQKPSKSIESCPDCKFMYYVADLSDITTVKWTTWNNQSQTPTQITSGLYDNYEELIATTGKNYFLGVKLNNNNEVTNAYACGVKDNEPFCIEGTSDGSKYADNQTLLQGSNLYNNTCSVDGDLTIGSTECGPWDDSGSLSAFADSDGNADSGSFDRCTVGNDGYFGCSESSGGGD